MNDMTPRLSIIIPVYNLSRWLDRCLESIIAQYFADFEVLLVDDGSSDNSVELCDSWQRRDERIRVFHKPNGGVSSARNLGLDNAKGDFITFVDGDDYILPGMYERMMVLQKEHDADITICGFSQEQNNGTFAPYFCCDEVKTLSQQEQVSCLLTNRYYTCSCCDKVFRRKLVEDLRYDTRITHYEDLLFCYEAMKRSVKAVFTAEPFYRYCANDSSSASRKPFGDKQMTMLDVWDFIHADAPKYFPRLQKTIDAQFYRNYIMCAMMAKKSKCCSYESRKRLKNTIRKSILRILLSDELALGYKINSFLV